MHDAVINFPFNQLPESQDAGSAGYRKAQGVGSQGERSPESREPGCRERRVQEAYSEESPGSREPRI